MADKPDKNTDFRDASIDASMPLVAKAIAHLLVNASPEVVKKIFGGKTVLGIPSEIASVLGGGGAGLVLAKAIEHFYPGIDPKTKDRIMDLAPMVTAEFNHILQEKGGGAGKASAPTFTPKRLMLCDSHPGVVYLLACPANHHSVTTYEEVNSGNGKKQKQARTTPRDDCHMVATAIASALMEKEGRTPSSSDEGLNTVCICETEVAAEITRFREEKDNAEKAKVEASKPKKPLFRPETVARYDKIADGTLQGVSDVFHGIDHGFRKVGNGIKTAAEKGEKLVVSLPAKAKTLDARVTASAVVFAAKQKRLEEIEDFAWENRIKNSKGFTAWVLERNIVNLKDKVHIAEMHTRFGERSPS